ncbi:MAG: AzlC family ABC transporter permease [Vicinamibacterales bacterium]
MTAPDACAPHTLTARGLARGASASIALGLASSVLGAGLGVAARQAAVPLWATLLMSGTVFAGAAQFAALTLWVAPLPYAPIWLSTFAVNARFALLTASLSPWLRHYRGWVQALSAFLMGEGQWAIASNAHLRGERDIGVFVGSGLVVWSVWMIGTATGYLAAPLLGDPRRLGLDLVLTLFFAGTLTTTWRGPRDLVPWSAAALATRLSPWLVAPEWQILVAALVGATVGALRDARG